MTSDWQRLAQLVVRRRGALGLTQVEVAQRGPLSLDRVQAIEGMRSTRYRAGTIAALERALEWRHGSVEAILAGGDPTPIEGAAGEQAARQEPPPDDVRYDLSRLSATDEEAWLLEMREVSRRYLEAIEKRLNELRQTNRK